MNIKDLDFINLDNNNFESLTEKEKNYLYWLYRSTIEGAKIILTQNSLESGYLFILFIRLFSKNILDNLYNDFKKEDIEEFLKYVCLVFNSTGNYLNNKKIIPKISKNTFKNIVLKYLDKKDKIDSLLILNLDFIIEKVYINISKEVFPNNDNIFYKNMLTEDIILINEFMNENSWSFYNTRIIKVNDDFIIKVASINKIPKNINIKNEYTDNKEIQLGEYTYKGKRIFVEYGDYDYILSLINNNLNEAIKYVDKDIEKEILKFYIDSFENGSNISHQIGSYLWSQNKNPKIETYIGFIETYNDPFGLRGDFESFVAINNNEKSLKLQILVDRVEEFIDLLPWSKYYEKINFFKPNVAALDIINFSTISMPIGINIPNYDKIRQYYGFKNLSLSNILKSSILGDDNKNLFIGEECKDLYHKYKEKSLEIQVILHELLGHGSGRLNPDIYNNGKTYDYIFSNYASVIEECRAECVGLYLSCNEDILKIFGYENKEAGDVFYINWLNELNLGFTSLLYNYNDIDKKWNNAHSQSRFIIFNICFVLGKGLVKIKNLDNKIYIELDRKKIKSNGLKIIGEFLKNIQKYKFEGDFTNGKKLLDNVSKVNKKLLELRDKVLKLNKDEKRISTFIIQPNIIKINDNIIIKKYESSIYGYINSFVDRFTIQSDILEYLEHWNKNKDNYI